MNTNVSSSTMSQWLLKATQRLEAANIATARLDCLVLLEDALNKDRSWILAHPEAIIPAEAVKRLNKQLERRTGHEPLAYIRGKTEFYGREFLVNAHTLEPRPETEDMIDLLRMVSQELQPEAMSMVDVGTGSGAIGITAALELGITKIDLLDIDKEALELARQNVKRHGLDLDCRYSDLLPADHGYNIILANLPYVPDSHTINEAAMREPKHAIFGGSDGLDLYRRLFKQALPAQFVFTESLPFQHQTMVEIARENGYTPRCEQAGGFIQLFERH